MDASRTTSRRAAGVAGAVLAAAVLAGCGIPPQGAPGSAYQDRGRDEGQREAPMLTQPREAGTTGR